jgi:hypothetical protein
MRGVSWAEILTRKSLLGWLLRPPYYPESHGLVPGGNTIANGRATWIAFASATCSRWHDWLAVLEQALKAYDSGSAAGRAYIQGLDQGYDWATTAIQTRNQAPLYCSPKQISLTVEQRVSILKDYLAKVPAGLNEPVGLSLLLSMQLAFPCK